MQKERSYTITNNRDNVNVIKKKSLALYFHTKIIHVKITHDLRRKRKLMYRGGQFC